jgi:hypothetical protein
LIILSYFFKPFIAEKVCTTCSRTNYKIVPLPNFNKGLHNDTSEKEVDINTSENNGGEIFLEKKKKATSGKLIQAVHRYTLRLFMFIFPVHVCQVTRV